MHFEGGEYTYTTLRSAAPRLPVQVDLVDQFVQDNAVPGVQARLPAADELHGRIDETYSMCPLPRLGRVCGGGLLPDLPLAPNFVSEAPVLDVMRLVFSRILTPKVGIIAVAPSAISKRNVASKATYVSPVPLQYSIQCRASSRLPVPMFKTMYGSILATRHQATNLQVTASVTSLVPQRHMGCTRLFRIGCFLRHPRPTLGAASSPLADRSRPSSYRS